MYAATLFLSVLCTCIGDYCCRHATWLLLEGDWDRLDHLRLRRISVDFQMHLADAPMMPKSEKRGAKRRFVKKAGNHARINVYGSSSRFHNNYFVLLYLFMEFAPSSEDYFSYKY